VGYADEERERQNYGGAGKEGGVGYKEKRK